MKIAFFEVPKEEQIFFSQAFSGSEVLFFEEKWLTMKILPPGLQTLVTSAIN